MNQTDSNFLHSLTRQSSSQLRRYSNWLHTQWQNFHEQGLSTLSHCPGSKASYLTDNGVNLPDREAGQLPRSNTQANNVRSYTPTLPCLLMA
jgi:hypothetical protein